MNVFVVVVVCVCVCVRIYVNDEPESKFLYIETIKLYCIVSYCITTERSNH